MSCERTCWWPRCTPSKLPNVTTDGPKSAGLRTDRSRCGPSTSPFAACHELLRRVGPAPELSKITRNRPGSRTAAGRRGLPSRLSSPAAGTPATMQGHAVRRRQCRRRRHQGPRERPRVKEKAMTELQDILGQIPVDQIADCSEPTAERRRPRWGRRANPAGRDAQQRAGSGGRGVAGIGAGTAPGRPGRRWRGRGPGGYRRRRENREPVFGGRRTRWPTSWRRRTQLGGVAATSSVNSCPCWHPS